MYKPLIFTLIIFSTMALSQGNRTAFINGKIYTVNDKQPFAEAVIVEKNKIVFVGTNQDAKKLIRPSDEVINLDGKFLLPGFIDAHVHLINAGFYLLGINLHDVKNPEEFKKALKDYLSKNKSEWIRGGRWDHEKWNKKKLPAKELIDDVTPDIPVFVERVDGHMGLANSCALRLAGINKDTPDPPGGSIDKDPVTGEPTGILKDNAMTLIYKVIPPYSFNDNYEAALKALETAKQFGITGVHDISFKEHLDIYKKLEDEGKLSCRIYSILPINQIDYLADSLYKKMSGKKIKVGALKAYADGSLGAGTAWFFEPYVYDSALTGLPSDVVLNGKLEEWAFRADKRGLQVCIHAIGDKANSWALDLYEKIRKEDPYRDRRFRIEHAQHVRPEDISRFASCETIASCQPYHAIDDGVWAEKRIGPDRIKYSYPYKTLIKAGVKVSFGSDWPVAPINPIMGIYSAVTRRTLDGKNPEGWIPEQKISVEEAIKCYTLNNAYASFEEDIKGSIEPGKLADFVVLDQDILTVDSIKIKDIKVMMTILDGEIIYQAE
jgi:predicted amidohydrolase YtcJ